LAQCCNNEHSFNFFETFDKSRIILINERARTMIEYELSNGVAVITLDRAPVNAWDDDHLDQFQATLGKIEVSEASVILVRSALYLFSAGADLSAMHQKFQTAEGRLEMSAFVAHIQDTYAQLEASKKITIAEIGGAALGGGLELALACDFRIAAHEAKLGLPEAALGLLPGAGGTQRLPRMVGEGQAKRMILGAETVSGEEARQIGLAQWSVPRNELPAFAMETALRLAKLPGHAVELCKSCIDEGIAGTKDGFQSEREGSATLFAHPETHTRVEKFLAGQR
jgi:enoyl-CoA hydratase